MLGRVMETFDDATLGRFLTSKMGIGPYGRKGDCFWRVVNGVGVSFVLSLTSGSRPKFHPFIRCAPAQRTGSGYWFDCLCRRFGTERIATLIRTRALKILAVRELSKGAPNNVSVETVEV